MMQPPSRPDSPSSVGVDAAGLAELVANEVRDQTAGPFRGLRAWRDRFDTILRVVTDGVVVLDFTSAVVYANAPACRIVGLDDPSAILGHDLDALYARRRALREDGTPLPPADLPGRCVPRAREHEDQLVGFEAPDGAARWAVARVAPIWDAEQRPAAVILILRDVTEARRAEARLRLLADAGALLGTQLDVRPTIEATARLLVPRLGEVAAVVLTEAPHAAHAERAGDRDASAITAAAAAWWAGAAHELAGAPAQPLEAGAQRWPAFASEAGMRHAIIAPLVTRDRTLGVLLVLTARGGFDALDVEAASDVARRAALAVDAALAYRRLEEVNRQLSEADRRKDEFLAILAHELRNPLTPMLTCAELLRTRHAKSDLDELVPILERQTRHLARLVDDLLDVSRIKHGKIELRRSSTALAMVIARALETCAPVLESRRHTVIVDVPDGLSLLADPLRLAQVFGNLVHNAAKYTDAGGRVAVRAHVDGDRVVVTVEDTGIGISREFLPRVFDLFAQDHGGRLHGLGVGLHMARTLVELHGGVIAVDSEGSGRGSRFTVTLPGVLTDAPEREGRASVDTVAVLRDVLIVDDDADVAAVLGKMLRRLGCDPRIASDGPTALAMTRERAPDLVILDLGMPGMSGYEVARELRAMRLASTRIVALSGYAQEGDRRRAREAGFDLHLAKPTPMRVLAALVSGAELVED